MLDGIQNLKIFSGIENEIINEILANTEEKTFLKGQLLFIQGAKSNGEGYIIKSGKVKISIDYKEITQLGSGEIVGEIALLNEDERTATVEALEDTNVIVITIDTLINLISNGNESINKDVINRIEENIKNM